MAARLRAAGQRDNNTIADAAAAVFEGAALSNFPDDVELYARITCPVLILQPESDAAHPLAAAERLMTLLPNAVLQTFPGQNLQTFPGQNDRQLMTIFAKFIISGRRDGSLQGQ